MIRLQVGNVTQHALCADRNVCRASDKLNARSGAARRSKIAAQVLPRGLFARITIRSYRRLAGDLRSGSSVIQLYPRSCLDPSPPLRDAKMIPIAYNQMHPDCREVFVVRAMKIVNRKPQKRKKKKNVRLTFNRDCNPVDGVKMSRRDCRTRND